MNYILNPEAPEFYPYFTTVTQDGYTTVRKTIQSSNVLPAGASHEIFTTYTGFNVVTYQLSENIVGQSNNIVSAELPSVKLKPNNIEYNTEKIVDVNDSILDRVNINIDDLTGANKPSDNFLASTKLGKTNPWDKGPLIAKIKVGSTTFIGAKNIPRPQLSFKDKIDNSESLWVPKISDKPNSIKPLSLNILYDGEAEAVGYEHPYQMELDLYHPPAQFIDPDPVSPEFPLPLAETRLTLVDTEKQLDELVAHLETVKEIAVDVEHHSYRTYQGITCLIQISTNEGGDYIVDTLALREHMHKLNSAFTNPKKMKVFHGAESDVIWLQRDFGVYIVGMFDTHQAARALKSSGHALKNLLLKYCNINADKRYQLADWRMRPLPDELIEYARMDTHCLLYIWRQQKRELLEAANGHPNLLLAVFQQSQQICGSTYNKPVVHSDSHIPLYNHSKKSFNTKQMAALQMIYKWRDVQARLLDESTTYLLPNHMMLSLAEAMPRDMQGINALCHPMPPFVKQNLGPLHEIILTCRELPEVPHLYQMSATLMSMSIQLPVLRHDVHDLDHYVEYSEDRSFIAVEELQNEPFATQPDIEVLAVPNRSNSGVTPGLNVEAKMFTPPYDRYRAYRSIAQVEEIKEYKTKIEKIDEQAKIVEPERKLTNIATQGTHAQANAVQQAQRKRKMSTDRQEKTGQDKGDPNKRKEPPKNTAKNSEQIPEAETKKPLYNSQKSQVRQGGKNDRNRKRRTDQ